MKSRTIQVSSKEDFIKTLKPIYDDLFQAILWGAIMDMDINMLNGIFGKLPLPAACGYLLERLMAVHETMPETELN